MIAENFDHVIREITEAATAAGRDPGSVHLVAVSKTKPVSMIREAYDWGQRDFGENRVQELRDKWEELQDSHPDIRWHMIGVLQRNKVKYIAPFVSLIHSVDSEKLLREIDKQAVKAARTIDCLLQLNISDEPQKGGFTEAEAAEALRHIGQYPGLRVRGLMGMAEFTDDASVIRAQFRCLAEARTQLAAHEGPQVSMDILSMGMSGDFHIAIAEGATHIRIGSSLFGTR